MPSLLASVACPKTYVLVVFCIEFFSETCIVHLLDFIHLLAAFIKRYENRLLIVIWPERCVYLDSGIYRGFPLSRVVNNIQNRQLHFKKSE
jgi:hypothetical protein